MTYVSDIESEQLVLGTILSKSVDVAYWCSVRTPACFTDLHCCAIYQAMQEILERGEEVNISSVDAQIRLHNAIFSKEMTNLDTLSRMVSMGTEDTAASWIMTRPLNSSHYQQAINELQLLQTECGDRVFFDDSRSLKLDDITSSIRQLHKKHHIKLAFVDYLQLLTYDEQHSRNTTQEQLMGQYSRVLKNLGDRLGICIVALSQLNRNVQHMHPSLSVIRDSGQIAEASDYVMFVWRPSVNQLPYDGKYASCPTNDTAMLIVAKNRQGPTLETIIGWKGITTSFYDLSDQQLSQLLHGSTPTAQSKNKQLQRTLFDES